MNESDKQRIIENYRRLFSENHEGPGVGQWSAEGQRFRFAKLAQVADLRGTTILDIGCGIGDLYPFLMERYGSVVYTGVDIVPELVKYAAEKYKTATFHCADLLAQPLEQKFDYVLMSGVFNNEMEHAGEVLERLATVAFRACNKAIAFNFTSNRVSRVDPGMSYHDPVKVFRFCIEHLSKKVTLAHHYERCDVAVYVYRETGS